MRPVAPKPKSARLNCEALEDRVNPVAAFALSGVSAGAASLLAFDTGSPGITTTTTLSGVATNEILVGIDFRPQNGQLYGLGVDTVGGTLTGRGTIYNISTRTGLATPIGATGSVDPTNPTNTTGTGTPAPLPNPATAGFAFDFNPTVDKIRVLTTAGQSFVVDQNTGSVVINNGNVQTATAPSGTSYTNTQPNAAVTTQYTIDPGTQTLYRQIPGTGVTTPVGLIKLGSTTGPTLTFSAVNGFDIPTGVNVTAQDAAVTTGLAFASLTVGVVSQLYTIDLTNGVATNLGTIGSGTGVSGLAIQNDFGGFPAIGLTGVGPGTASLIRFNTSAPADPNNPAPVTITNLTQPVAGIGGDTLVGIAYRPQTGQLFGLGVASTGANAGRGTLYRIDPQTGAATIIGTAGSVNIATPDTGPAVPGATLPAPATAGYAFAFNATVDRIRVITSTGGPNGAGLSFVINQLTGTVQVNSPAVNGATTGGTNSVDSGAYTNSFGQAAGGPTTLYTLDSASDALYLQNASSSLTTRLASITTPTGTPINFTSATGFELAPGVAVGATNAQAPAPSFGYAALTLQSGGTNLYLINLATGVATSLGALPTGTTGLTLSDAPAGVFNFSTQSLTVNEGGAATITITRNSGRSPATVLVSLTGGSATPGSDVFAGPIAVQFADGSMTATLTLPFTPDMLTEGTETLNLTLSSPGAVFGTNRTLTITINDTSTTPPTPPAFSGATAIPGGVILSGSSVPGGTAFLALPPGSSVFFAELNGDGKNDLIFFLPGLVAVLDGQTGRFLALVADLNGDAVQDFQLFNADGTSTRTNGRTGMVF